MEKVYKWRLICSTHGVVHNYNEDDATVPKCPIVDTDSITGSSIVSSIEKSQTKVVQELPQGGKRVTDRGFQFDAAANTETSFDFKFEESLFVKDGELEVTGHDFKDFAYMALVDVDNILGFGAGLVLHEYIKNYPINAKDTVSVTHVRNQALSEIDLNGLYMRVKYHNHTGSTVRCKVRVNGYS